MSSVETITNELAMRRVLDLARRAPSVHNTQPWAWRLHEGFVLELFADRTRQLRAVDPDGRDLLLSCGAALHHAVMAAHVLGWASEVDQLPDPRRPELLARLRLRPAPPPQEASALLRAITERFTDRRRFTAWPIPLERLEELAAVGRHQGAHLAPVVAPGVRARLELLLSRAMIAQEHDLDVRQEEEAWIGRTPVDGLSAPLVAPRADRGRRRRPTRFDHADVIEREPLDVRDIESSDGVLLLGTANDGTLARLQAGMALSAVWLEATLQGFSLIPLSQVVEVAETRVALAADVAAPRVHPQLLLRIGWQEIGRSDLLRTPRRSVDDLLGR